MHRLRMDNGPEYISTTLADWAEEHTIDQYNEERPHDARGDLTPFEYREAHQAARIL